MLNVISGTLSAFIPPFSPLSLPNLKAWYDASDTSSITGGSQVSQWNDKSGNAFNLSQGTSSKRPSSGTRTMNGLNTIDYDGTNDILTASTASDWTFLSNSSKSTAFAVYILDDLNPNAWLCTHTIGTTIGYSVFYNAGLGAFVSNGTADVVFNSTGQTTTTGNHYAYWLTDTTAATAADRSEIYIDGVLKNKSNTATATASSSTPYYALSVGGREVDDAYSFNGAMAEIIIVSGLMSAGDITLTKNYLTTKWGL
jgi:hypothetical protein